ncbi:DUF3443 domain-containing protein [Geomonas sp. Red32]|uniref:DUF3443 family protein n=1 Tax=Geomonas sp. Red32 TaxID=2912856 RepID=UPI00202CB129|nr:DUF3443 family protein [Geomonas sp. Red32]MCM0081539.1 DUF3443 domain-containing protein [Geomonas sp. Red32]
MTFDKFLARAAIVLTLFSLIGLAGCGGGGGGGGPAPSSGTLVSVSLKPATSTFVAGKVFNFILIGTYSDNTTADITSTATWTTSATSVATVSDTAGSKGTATAVAQGTATITATVTVTPATTTTTTTTPAVTFTDTASVTVIPSTIPLPGGNVMQVTVNGGLCSSATSVNYFNKPCVAVTICNPDGSGCQTINDILLDTGSVGLRLFKQAIPASITTTQVTVSGGNLAGCVQFADGSSFWGPIQTANIQLGGETPVSIPIQVVDSTFGNHLVSPCSVPDTTPLSAGMNGILGVNTQLTDCGTACVQHPLNSSPTESLGRYYACSGTNNTNCVETRVQSANQVQNPVASLSQDNNGIQLIFPPVPFGGTTTVTGSMILGIGTQGNNTPTTGQQTVFPVDSTGDFATVYPPTSTANTWNAFLDTGSNAYYIPNANPGVLPPCSSPNSAWYCPPVTRALIGTAEGALGSPRQDVPFNVGNFIALFNTNNNVFSDIAGVSSFGFDWGLPFFLGRKTYFGYPSRTTTLGTGPYVAF